MKKVALAASLLLAASPAWAQPEIVSDSGDTAWVLIASALVLMMTLPGLALFYGGLVRARNVLSVIMHCFIIACGVSLIWALFGYSLVFSGEGALLGDFAKVGLRGLDDLRDGLTIPESTFALYQMTFAIITPALIIGAFVERIRFGWMVAFSMLWTILVYIPVAHWVWGGGWLQQGGTLDFAGGIVVHTTAGVAALILAWMIRPRRGFNKTLLPPHSPALTMTGAGLLWVGWYGFNGGSALAAGDAASSAIINTHLAACSAAIAWLVVERMKIGKPTSIGIVTGAIAGLATVTPAAGFIGPMGAIAMGILGGVVCFYCVLLIKQKLHIDDSLDVFAVHGVGGIMGSLILPIFILEALGGPGFEQSSLVQQLVGQFIGVAATIIWTAIMTFGISFVLTYVSPMRVDVETEHDGLDLSSHGERGWDLDA